MAQRKRHRSRKPRRAPPSIKADLSIEMIGARGDGVATREGTKVFVPYSVPGDVIDASISGNRGKIDAIIKPGQTRTTPPCSHFSICGGCALQHVEESFYHDWKRHLVVDALRREEFDEDLVGPLIACAADSRRRARFAVRRTSAGLIFGFNQRGSVQIEEIESCVVLDPALQKVLPALKTVARATPERWRSFDMAVNHCDNGVDACLIGGDAADDLSGREMQSLTTALTATRIIRLSVDDALLANIEVPRVSLGGVPVSVPPGAFLQASLEGEAALVSAVEKAITGARHVADLFSGIGTFSLPVSRSAAVDAFDADQAAISALDAATRTVPIKHPLKTHVQNLFDRPVMAKELKPFDAVIFDPPRAGAQMQAAEIAASDVPRVVGVSCNPTSFARDAAILRDGGYALSQVTPVDQFVYAPHVELVGIFTKG